MFWSGYLEKAIVLSVAGFLLFDLGGIFVIIHIFSKFHFMIWHYVVAAPAYGIGIVATILFYAVLINDLEIFYAFVSVRILANHVVSDWNAYECTGRRIY